MGFGSFSDKIEVEMQLKASSSKPEISLMGTVPLSTRDSYCHFYFFLPWLCLLSMLISYGRSSDEECV